MPTNENVSVASDKQSVSLDAISQRLVNARSTAEALPRFPGELPDSLDDAYAIQTMSIARWPDKISGWKVGMVPDTYRDHLGAERLSGPIFESTIATIDFDKTNTMPIFAGGFAALEAEFVIRLGTTIEPQVRSYSDDELYELVSGLHVGAEIASSPMADVNRLGPCSVVSDFGNNAGLLVGPSIPDWQALPPSELTVAVHIDGECVGSASAAAIPGGLLQALRFLIDVCARRSLVLEAGTLVSSGAVTGIHDVTTASEATVRFGAFDAFDVNFQPIQPGQLAGNSTAA